MILLVAATTMEMDAFVAASPRAPVQRLVCGVGPMEAAFWLGLFLAEAQSRGTLPELVLNIGVAGAYVRPEGPGLLDLCLATQEHLGDLGKCEAGRLLPLSCKTNSSFSLSVRARGWLGERLEQNKESVFSGPFLTVHCVSGDRSRADMLLARFPEALCENMEGAGLALACSNYNVRFAELRCISNIIDDPERQQWRLKEAVQRCGKAAASLFQEEP